LSRSLHLETCFDDRYSLNSPDFLMTQKVWHNGCMYLRSKCELPVLACPAGQARGPQGRLHYWGKHAALNVVLDICLRIVYITY
jgi:hypothetical protein